MIIDQLPLLSLPVQDTDEIPIERGQLTFKVLVSDLVPDVPDNLILQADVVTVSANGTTSNTLTGLTANHVVGNWGMFSDAACTTPIPENAPTCDITITTAANSWSCTIANFSATFYLRPTFVLKQN